MGFGETKEYMNSANLQTYQFGFIIIIIKSKYDGMI